MPRRDLLIYLRELNGQPTTLKWLLMDCYQNCQRVDVEWIHMLLTHSWYHIDPYQGTKNHSCFLEISKYEVWILVQKSVWRISVSRVDIICKCTFGPVLLRIWTKNAHWNDLKVAQNSNLACDHKLRKEKESLYLQNSWSRAN